jgi:hypothetical protein
MTNEHNEMNFSVDESSSDINLIRKKDFFFMSSITIKQSIST